MARWQARHSISLLVALVSVSLETGLVRAAAPKFENIPAVETLYENTNIQTTITPFSCTDVDTGDTPVVSLADVTPSTPCGTCFAINPCGGPDEWCLVFLPNQGSLDYAVAPTYDILAECTDGVDVVNATIDVRLIFNTPPRFDPDQLYTSDTLSNTKTHNAGKVIATLSAVDADNDAIFFTMTSSPASDNFEIGYTDGIIRATHDLVAECRNSITFFVNISDGINDPVGPHTVHVDLNGNNEAPDITNLDTSIQVPEDTPVGDVMRAIVATDDDNTNKLTYSLAASPTANLAYFTVDGSDIKINSALDYELSSARVTNLTLIASDGACTSPLHYLHVTVTDVNEAPDLYPKDASYETYEGSISVSVPWNVQDPDFYDSATYTIIEGNDLGRFRIDQSTGQIKSNIDYDVDNNAMPQTVTLRVKVEDKGGLSDNTTVTLNILDANDNRPAIVNRDHDYTVGLCNARAGRTLGTLQCTDEDSSFQQNNDTYFGGSGSGITILPSGNIILNTLPAEGQTLTATAYCRDRGQYPSSLQSSDFAVSATGRECTTVFVPTAAPTAAPTTTQLVTTTTTAAPITTAAPSTENTTDWLDENLGWIIAAAILATLLLGLLMYMILIYCWSYCVQCCRQEWCKRRPPRPKRIQTPPPRKVKPATPPRTPPAPVVGPQDAHLHPFWKEKYPDNDYLGQPNRATAPRPVTPTGDLPFQNGNPGQQGPPAKKPRSCVIL